jgi:hypothetical protein
MSEEDTQETYRKFGAGKGLPRSIQNLDIVYIAIITIILCIMAVIVTSTFAVCFWILDKAL